VIDDDDVNYYKKNESVKTRFLVSRLRDGLCIGR
jgi:hypothetical protein